MEEIYWTERVFAVLPIRTVTGWVWWKHVTKHIQDHPLDALYGFPQNIWYTKIEE